jgi:glutamate racemase
VVLGCTHYPFAADLLAQLLGPDVALVDTGVAVARRTRDVLNRSAPINSAAVPPLLWSTGDPAALSQAAQRWLGLQTRAEKLTV